MMWTTFELPDEYVPGKVKVEILDRFEDGSIEPVMAARMDSGDKTIQTIISATGTTDCR
jgi:hypothetical protein